jgi:hypothetical protein
MTPALPFNPPLVSMLGDVFAQTRSILNDDDAANWPDPRLMGKARFAFQELESELLLWGIPLLHTNILSMDVPAVSSTSTTDLDLSTLPGYPVDMILPIWMKERMKNETRENFVDMVETSFIPNVSVDTALRYWTWREGRIYLLGALVDNQIQLRYQRLLPSPGVNTDSIFVPLGQLFLAYRVASLAMESLKEWDSSDRFMLMAKENLDRLMRHNVKQQQNVPAKRRPYHRGLGRTRVLRDY